MLMNMFMPIWYEVFVELLMGIVALAVKFEGTRKSSFVNIKSNHRKGDYYLLK